jgi:predicted alpha/beta superfamily hydrolase
MKFAAFALATFATIASLASANAGATTVRIHSPAGAAGMQVQREGAASAPRAAKRKPGTAEVWRFHWPDGAGAITMRPLLKGTPSTGGAYRIAAGASVDIYPFFGPATGQVAITDPLASPQLGNSRRLRIYTPPSYAENPYKRYPVIYMHDGQNLFDPKTASFGTAWDIGATVDRLVKEGRMDEVIVVGIDNSPARVAEYTPCCDPKHGGGQLDAYEAFIVDTVKPYIDQQLRTLPGRAHTAIMGSSLGGIASIIIASHRAAVFSKAAGMSSSFWWNEGDLVKHPLPRLPLQLYLDAGTVDDGLADTRAMHAALQAQGYVDRVDLMLFAAEGGRHNEASWAARVDRPLVWFFPWGATRQ